MIFVNELKHLKLYNRQVQLPINEKNKLKGSAVFLLTPDIKSSLKLLDNTNILHKYYKSYYMEKNILYYVNQEGYIVSEAGELPSVKTPTIQTPQIAQPQQVKLPDIKTLNTPDVIKKIKYANRTYSHKSRKSLRKINNGPNISSANNQSQEDSVKEIFVGTWQDEYIKENGIIKYNIDGNRYLYPDIYNIQEANSVFNTSLYKFLYKDRIRNDKDVLLLYKNIKNQIPYIKKTFIDINKYKGDNLFIDLSYYINIFFSNNIYKLDKAINIFYEFIDRQINDKRLISNGYVNKTIIIPVNDWIESINEYKYTNEINPISMILRLLKRNINLLHETWKNCNILFLGNYGYFKCNLDELKPNDNIILLKQLERIRIANSTIKEDEPIQKDKESKETIISNVIDSLETSQKIKIHNLTGSSNKDSNTPEEELIEKIKNAAETSNNTDEAIDKLDQDDYIKDILNDLISQQNDTVKISAARSARIDTLKKNYLDKKFNNKSIKDIINENDDTKELPTSSFKIDSPNDTWKKMKYINFEKTYNLDADILAIFNSLSEKQPSLSIIDIQCENTSTSEDLINTWTVKYETESGVRGKFKVDTPIIKDYKFMKLRGNDKTINSQQFRIPISKSDKDTVQIVSNYNKIFISTYGSSVAGKSFEEADRLIKTLNKYNKYKIVFNK